MEKFDRGSLERISFNKFDIVESTIETEEEFVEIVGNAYYKKAKDAHFPEHAAYLIKQAARHLHHATFEVVDDVPPEDTEQHELVIIFQDPDARPEIETRLKESGIDAEYRKAYGVGIASFLCQESISVDASEFKKVTT